MLRRERRFSTFRTEGVPFPGLSARCRLRPVAGRLRKNRHRRDISDYERACSYAVALGRYYGGRQSVMARRLEISESWLSRRLALARLPEHWWHQI
ncbi:hypothetical protein [Poseidonocella sp. HB161398]|uniref:hypothetical protein n=1 Tax=Poseidonocella sp. HB161398 TaxID=2320855 RepID=UPI0014869A7B|nr:hypothetical protein [Poseidonocella sp. HB161398]